MRPTRVRYHVQPTVAEDVAAELDRRALALGISRSGYVAGLLHDHVGAPRLTTNQKMSVNLREELLYAGGRVTT